MHGIEAEYLESIFSGWTSNTGDVMNRWPIRGGHRFAIAVSRSGLLRKQRAVFKRVFEPSDKFRAIRKKFDLSEKNRAFRKISRLRDVGFRSVCA
jgi:hypothetical protein